MQVIRIRVALGHAADELKRAKGIITAAGEGAKNGAIFGLYCFGDGGIILFGAGSGAMGTDEKGFFALGQVLGGVMDHGIMEFGVIDAGGEADAVVLRQAGARRKAGWRLSRAVTPPCGCFWRPPYSMIIDLLRMGSKCCFLAEKPL